MEVREIQCPCILSLALSIMVYAREKRSYKVSVGWVEQSGEVSVTAPAETIGRIERLKL